MQAEKSACNTGEFVVKTSELYLKTGVKTLGGQEQARNFDKPADKNGFDSVGDANLTVSGALN